MQLMLLTSLIVFAFDCNSQAVDHTHSFRSTNAVISFRIMYENDFFTASDRDYTQGVYLELISPLLKKAGYRHLLWTPDLGNHRYGMAVETNGYTPNNIDRASIQYGDRPYASTLLLKVFHATTSSADGLKLTNTLTTGILGPGAGGKEIQQGIHHAIGYTQPLGWHHQIRNEPIINYQLNAEKKLIRKKGWMMISTGMARVGNLSTRANFGIALLAGKFNDPFDFSVQTRKIRFHIYGNPQISFIGYDATLSGGIFNKQSPYTIASKNINRVVFQNRFGLILSVKSWMLEYFQSFSTREFHTGVEHRTGGFTVAYKI